MRRQLGTAFLLFVAAAAGAGGAWYLFRHRGPSIPDGPSVVERMREVARLETLHLSVYKKISFEPAPAPAASMWGDLANWVRYTVRKPQGRAIVFAEVEVGMDLERLSPQNLRISGPRIEVVLPPPQAQVRLLPGETEVIGSNLDSKETALLFEKAKVAFEREITSDPKLMDRARAANERALRALFITLGFREIVFVDRLSGGAG